MLIPDLTPIERDEFVKAVRARLSYLHVKRREARQKEGRDSDAEQSLQEEEAILRRAAAKLGLAVQEPRP